MEKDNPNGLNFDSFKFVDIGGFAEIIYDADGNQKPIQEGMCGIEPLYGFFFKIHANSSEMRLELFYLDSGNTGVVYNRPQYKPLEIDPKDFDKIKRAHEGYMSVIKAVEKKYQRFYGSILTRPPQFCIQGTTSILHP